MSKASIAMLAHLLLLGLQGGRIAAQPSPSNPPVSLTQVRKALDFIRENGERSDPLAGKQRLAAAIRQRGVDFEIDSNLAESLRRDGATEELLAAITAARPPAALPPPPDLLERARSAAARKDWPAAQAAYSAALSSSVLEFKIWMARPGENFGEPCDGLLRLSRAGIGIDSGDCGWKQEIPAASIGAALANRFLGIGVAAFRLTFKTEAAGPPAVFSLAPVSSDPGERAMLLQLIEQLRPDRK